MLCMHVHFGWKDCDESMLASAWKQPILKALVPSSPWYLLWCEYWVFLPPYVLPASSLWGDYVLLRNWFGHSVINVLPLVPGGGIQAVEGHTQQNAKFPTAWEVRTTKRGKRGGSSVSPQWPPNAPWSCGWRASGGIKYWLAADAIGNGSYSATY